MGLVWYFPALILLIFIVHKTYLFLINYKKCENLKKYIKFFKIKYIKKTND